MMTDFYRTRIWRKTLRYLQWPSFWCEGQYGKRGVTVCLHIGEVTEVKVSWMWVGTGILTVTPWEITGRDDRLRWFCGENKITLEKLLKDKMKSKWWNGKIIWVTDCHLDYASYIRGKKKKKSDAKLWDQRDYFLIERFEKPWLAEYPSDSVCEIYT